MKNLIWITGILAMIMLPHENVFAVSVPSSLETDNKEFSLNKNGEKLQQVSSELEMIITEIETEQENHKVDIEKIKKELREVKYHLITGLDLLNNKKEENKSSYIPTKVAWALGKTATE